jgi:hypothetical protein
MTEGPLSGMAAMVPGASSDISGEPVRVLARSEAAFERESDALERRVGRILPDNLMFRVTTPHGGVGFRVVVVLPREVGTVHIRLVVGEVAEQQVDPKPRFAYRLQVVEILGPVVPGGLLATMSGLEIAAETEPVVVRLDGVVALAGAPGVDLGQACGVGNQVQRATLFVGSDVEGAPADRRGAGIDVADRCLCIGHTGTV